MNETVDPARIEARPQQTPGLLPAPAPPKTRRWSRWLLVLVIAVAAIFAWQYFEKGESPPEPGPGSKTAQPNGAPPVDPRRGSDPGRHSALCERARDRDLARDRHRAHPDRRDAPADRLRRGPDGQGRRFPRPDRSAPLSGHARAGAGTTGQGHRAPRPGRGRSRALPDPGRAGFDRHASRSTTRNSSSPRTWPR